MAQGFRARKGKKFTGQVRLDANRLYARNYNQETKFIFEIFRIFQGIFISGAVHNRITHK
jgi:hypothetical protein